MSSRGLECIKRNSVCFLEVTTALGGYLRRLMPADFSDSCYYMVLDALILDTKSSQGLVPDRTISVAAIQIAW